MNVLRMLIAVVVLLAVAPVLADEAAKPAEAAPAAASRPAPPDCIRDTGSRIQHREDQCSGAPGRAISREDIDNSGAANVGDALRTLDPRVGLRR